MRKRAFIKDFWRTIKNSKGRFFAIFCMVAMGAGVFSGLNETSIDMKRTADKYYDDTYFMDIRLLSTYGFTDDDIDIISQQNYIESIMPGYSTDAIITLNDSNYVVRLHSIPLNCSDSDANYINRPVLVDGRMPQKDDECLLSTHETEFSTIKLGDTITLSNDDTLDGILDNRTYTVVGIVNSSYYISFVYGNSSIGNGSLSYFMYIPESSFCSDYYTDVYARISGAQELNCFSKEYEDEVDDSINKLEVLSEERINIRYNDFISSATDALNNAKEEYNEAEKEADDQLSKAFVSLTDAEKELSDKEQELIDAEKEIIDAEKALESAEDQINKAEKEYQSGISKYNKALSEYQSGLSEYNSAVELFAQQKSDYDSANAFYLFKLQEYENAVINGASPEDLDILHAEITALKSQLDTAASALAVFENQLSSTRLLLDQYKSELDKNKVLLDKAKYQISMGQKELKKGKKELRDGKAEIEDGKVKLSEAKEELSDAWTEYYQKKSDAEKELTDAKNKISDAEADIAEIEKPEWYILDRNTNSGFVSFEADADRMKSLATVFPFIFFLVAALVALTTMTRMVDEERLIIGTYKALGYSNIKIMVRYILYALFASLCGSMFGILILSKVLPQVIWAAYKMLYIAPEMITKYDPTLVLLSAGSATFCTLLSTFFACKNALSEQPSSLLLPRAPKPGKRIFLERIGFIWNKLSFNSKVTARNIFRYKKRMLMTLIGIAGCTSLVLTGFGVKDSVSDIVSNQFNIIYKYNTQITTEGTLYSDALDILNNSKYISSYQFVSQKGTEISSDETTVTGYIMIPESSDKFTDFILFRDRTSKAPITFDKNSVIISEKTAKELSVSVGDEIMVKDDSDSYLKFTVTGITENYIYHYIYAAPEIYHKVSKSTAEMNSVLCICPNMTEELENEFSDNLLKCHNIGTVVFTREFSETFNGMIDTLNLVTIVLIILAALLAFIVLYNLTNINITERRKELATIKVLGFYNREVSSYIFRETIILTVLGCILGLILGVFMHQLVIQTIEVDMVMFGRTISIESYIYSAMLTVLFSIIVEIIMSPKMKSIDMVESLKSVD